MTEAGGRQTPTPGHAPRVASSEARYHLIAEVSKSSAGDVWRARTGAGAETPGQIVMVKVAHGAAGVARLRREAAALSRLAGVPSEVPILSLVDIALGASTPYAVWRDPAAPTVQARVYRRGPIGEADVASLLADVLRALAFAHERGVVHGALGPGCVFVDTGYSAAVTDFGFGPIAGQQSTMEVGVASPAVLASRDVLSLSGETHAWFAANEFLAPEGQRGLFHPGTDLYAAGRLAAFALLGRESGRSTDLLLTRQGASAAMRSILANLSDPAPGGRYPSAAHALRVVETVFLNRAIRVEFRQIGGGDAPPALGSGASKAAAAPGAHTPSVPRRVKVRLGLILLLLGAAVLLPLVCRFVGSDKPPDTASAELSAER